MEYRIPRINEADEVIGETTIPEAVQNGWLRRVSRVYLFDHERNILLQRRSLHVVAYPNVWDQSAGGHVDVGEDYHAAALRETAEEIGVVDLTLTEVVRGYRTATCFESLYRGIIPRETPITFDPHEVSETR